MSEFDARLYDGKTARQRAVRITVAPAGLALSFADGADPVFWFWREVRQRALEFPTDPIAFDRRDSSGESLEVPDPAVLEAIRQLAPGVSLTEGKVAGRRLHRLAMIALVSLPLLIFGMWKFLPWFGEKMAVVVPVAVEDKLGESAADFFSRENEVCPDGATVAAVRAAAERLHQAGGPSPYTLRVRVVRNPMVNALAAPGGHIVVFQGLLELTSSEAELAGVLGHEITHVRRRHTTKMLFRQMGIWAGLAVLTGDVSGAVATVAGTAGILTFMREHETEADLEGLALMRGAGYDPAAMGTMFRKLQNIIGKQPKMLGYLSTHPDTAERIKMIDRATGRTTPEKVSYASDTEWQPVREGCVAR